MRVKFPVWLEPKAGGATPMCEAFRQARDLVADWVREHPDSFPPVVMNLTDGESSDGDPSRLAESIRSIASRDGNAILFNVHVSGLPGNVMLPHDEGALSDSYGRMLFNMSSVLPERMRQRGVDIGIPLEPGCRAFAFNSNPVELVQCLDIGTPVATGGAPALRTPGTMSGGSRE